MDIRATDFRIGNFLHEKESNETIRVDSIYFDALFPEVYLINGKPINRYKAIPIHEDWFKDLEFHWDLTNDEWLEYKDGIGLIVWRDIQVKGLWCIEQTDAKIKYIHELQNIYHSLYRRELI